MKNLLLRLAGGVVLGAAMVAVSGSAASASSGYDGGQSRQSNYHKQDYQKSDHYKKTDNNNYRKNDYQRHSQPKQTVVYKVVYQKPQTHYSTCSCGNNGQYTTHDNYGFWYNGKWYAFKTLGYMDMHGKWKAYNHDWNDYDWQQWRNQCH